MSNSEDYTAKLTEIEAIPENEIKKPNMPVDHYIQEAENTTKWAADGRVQLEATGVQVYE